MRQACKGHISSEKERDVVRRYLGVLVFVHISKALYSLCLLGVDAVCQLTDMSQHINEFSEGEVATIICDQPSAHIPENSAVFLKVVLIRQNRFHLLGECLFGEKAYIPFHSRSGNEWRWTNLANGKAISSEEVAILQSKKSTESQQLSGGHRQAVKKMVLNNVINVSKKLESI
ncbi:hypothetical protein D917_09895 [Trichinella nativa]|uniref:Uncharacterized protein n=1 Tax=Trichinella nativa TaxID=6335 RepID=A0A1Y3EDK7_9BILA|nr:hypothetical protein D917_09895 [Trichinella nativa]